jgi:mannose-1-phosphate guanylyltransferase
VQAVILAGGAGTRLRPLTLGCAKPVVPLLNRPFLAYQLALLREHGIIDVILACSYRVDDVRRALGDGSALGVRLRYAVEGEPLGTGGGLKNAADLREGTLVVLNGDVLTDADLSAMRRFHEARGSRTTLYLTRVPDPRAYGLVELETDGRLRAFREKPAPPEAVTAAAINAGIYMIDAGLLPRIPPGRMVSIEREFFPALIADGVPAFGWVANAYWRDIGSPAAYRAAQIDLLDGRVRTVLRPAGDEGGQGRWLGSGGRRAADARVQAPSVLGAGVVLERGAVVGPHTVIGDGSTIGAGARVAGAILWPGVRVGAGAVLRDCVVGAGARIGARAAIGPGVVLASGAEVVERSMLD